jgi:hypothetical protein
MHLESRDIAWQEHRKIAAVILHRKLDLMEVNRQYALDHPNESVGPVQETTYIWRGDMAGELNNIISYLKKVVAKKFAL